ncbi:MAG TPA: HrpB1 family type III secretion system apparatus protein [Chlamydiales bacterium]|nr:HrpB1 family type III secretion system apparatus protein [Chlamydiales bacterium]
MSWKNYKDDFFLMLESGFIAVNQADEDSALKLFRAAELLNPENSLPQVGFGYLHLHKLELTQAIKRFEDVLEQEPKNEMAKALLGICMSLSPQQLIKGEKVLNETLKSKDPMIKQLAGTAKDFVEKFVKTTPGPASGKGK